MKLDWMRASFVVVAVVLCGFVGCNLPDFRLARGNTPPKQPREENRKLSEKQIADVKLSLARSLEMEGQYDAALDEYRKAIDKSPKEATPYWRMAVINDRRGNIQESDQLYRKALALDPKNADIHCDYGYSLYLQRRWAEAEEAFREALKLSPQNRRAHNNFGLLLAQTERSEEALAEFKLAGCSPDDAHVNLAFVSMMNQRWDQARDEFQRALDANPGSAVARAGSEKLAALTARANGEPRTATAIAARNEAARPSAPPLPALSIPAGFASRKPAPRSNPVR